MYIKMCIFMSSRYCAYAIPFVAILVDLKIIHSAPISSR